MIKLLNKEIIRNGDKAKIISIQCMQNLKQDIEDLKENNSLNEYSKIIVSRYFKIELPKTDFKIQSIILLRKINIANSM